MSLEESKLPSFEPTDGSDVSSRPDSVEPNADGPVESIDNGHEELHEMPEAIAAAYETRVAAYDAADAAYTDQRHGSRTIRAKAGNVRYAFYRAADDVFLSAIDKYYHPRRHN